MKAGRIERALSAAFTEGGRRVIPLAAVREIASSEGLSVREFEAELLKEEIIPLRYLRNIGTFGTDGQAKLLLSSAAVAGCGGLGGWLTELLARAGVGRLTLIDGDVFTESNLNRQALCTESVLGRNKAEAAASRVRDVNSALDAVPHQVMLTEDNAETLLRKNSIVFDALDNMPSRKLLMKAAENLGLPMVHGAAAGWWGQVCTPKPGSGVLASLWEGRREKGIETETGTLALTVSAVASMQAAMGIRILLGLSVPADWFWLDMAVIGLEKIPLAGFRGSLP